MKKKINLVLIFLIAALGIVFYFLINKDVRNRERYKTVSPTLSSIEKTRYISGVVVPSKEIEIKSQFSGILEKLYCKEGDKVEEGDKIAKIKLISDPITLENARKNVHLTLIEFKDSQKIFERNETLFKDGVISQSEFEMYEKAYRINKKEYEFAVSQLNLLSKGYKNNIAELTNLVFSTTSGTVLELPLEEGSSIIERNNYNEGSTIATIADLSKLVFKGSINESDLTQVKVGMELDLSIPSLKFEKLGAKLVNIGTKGYEKNNIIYFDFSANLDSSNNRFSRIGISALAKIILDQKKDILVINEKNILFQSDSTFVEVLKQDGLLHKQYIETGISDGINIEIISGIKKEDIVKVR